ncbi:MAG TPA: hypothetical protein VFZ66_23945 [Herpetosiphonaceae bacterium]
MKRVAGSVVITLLLLGNVLLASQTLAHQYDPKRHWNNESGRSINFYNGADSYHQAATDARQDWGSNTHISFDPYSSHVGFHAFDGYYDTNWGGLAVWVDTYWTGTHHHTTHGHAILNTKYAGSGGYYRRGVFCQEIGHLLGLTHSNDGCMGMTYYNNINYTVPHNWSDVNNIYDGNH